jgi:hypothetical protein
MWWKDLSIITTVYYSIYICIGFPNVLTKKFWWRAHSALLCTNSKRTYYLLMSQLRTYIVKFETVQGWTPFSGNLETFQRIFFSQKIKKYLGRCVVKTLTYFWWSKCGTKKCRNTSCWFLNVDYSHQQGDLMSCSKSCPKFSPTHYLSKTHNLKCGKSSPKMCATFVILKWLK